MRTLFGLFFWNRMKTGEKRGIGSQKEAGRGQKAEGKDYLNAGSGDARDKNDKKMVTV